MTEYDVLIVGGGLSGLACGIELTKRKKSFKILEAGDGLGGRVRTDVIGGFRLDRGFQVLLTAYPEAERMLDYNALNLRKFKAGALIRFGGEFCRISDVIRHPADLPGNLFSKAATIGDKLKIASLRRELGNLSIADIGDSKNVSTLERLQEFGFSEKVISSFFRPFFGGVFLEPGLSTSRRMFDFVFKMFAEGDVVVPERGMGEISKQLAARIADSSVECNCRVAEIGKGEVRTEDGRVITANQVIVATDRNSAALLTKPGNMETGFNGVTCLYFSASQSPVNEPILVLNGDELEQPINNLCVPSDVSTAYAPQGKSLISITVLGDGHGDQLVEDVLAQAFQWYGNPVNDWKHLKTYEIQNGLPTQSCEDLETVCKPLATESGIGLCGDYLRFGSIQGALETGRLVAETID